MIRKSSRENTRLENSTKLTSVNKKEADLTTKIYRERERANRTSSASSVKTYLREIDRLQREIWKDIYASFLPSKIVYVLTKSVIWRVSSIINETCIKQLVFLDFPECCITILRKLERWRLSLSLILINRIGWGCENGANTTIWSFFTEGFRRA